MPQNRGRRSSSAPPAGLGSGDSVGRDVALVAGTVADMRGVAVAERPSLEIIYDAA